MKLKNCSVPSTVISPQVNQRNHEQRSYLYSVCRRKNGNALEALYKNKQALGLKKGEDILELGKNEYVYKSKGMNVFFGIKDKQMYATNDELLYKNIEKAETSLSKTLRMHRK